MLTALNLCVSHLTSTEFLLTHCPAGRRREWAEVYARPPHSSRGFERGISFSLDQLSTNLLPIYEGEHPYQQGSAGVYRRLWPYDHYWRRDTCLREGLSDVVDFKRHIDVIH